MEKLKLRAMIFAAGLLPLLASAQAPVDPATL